MLHSSCFLCSGSASGREANLPASILAAREPGNASIWQSVEFSGCQTQGGGSNTGQFKRTINVLLEGSLRIFAGLLSFSNTETGCVQTCWKAIVSIENTDVIFSFFILYHSAPLFSLNYRGSNKAFAAVLQK